MKEYCLAKGLKQLIRIGMLFCFFVALLPNSDLLAIPIPAVDSEGQAIDMEKELKGSPELYVGEIKNYLRRGNLNQAGYLARRMVDIRPNDYEIRAVYSLFLSANGSNEEAKNELMLAERDPKTNPYTLYARAMVLRYAKKYEAAIGTLKKAIALDRKHPYPWNILGRIYYDREQYREAITSFQKAIKLEPAFLPGYVNLGAATYIQKDYAGSIGYFNKALELNPKSHTAGYGLALAYEAVGNNAMAIEALKKGLASKPGDTLLITKLGELQLKDGQYEEALATGEAMEEAGLQKAYEILAQASLHLGKPQDSLRYLEKAPAENLDAAYIRGFCYLVEDRHEEALTQMESILQKNPTHFGAAAAVVILKSYLGREINPTKDLQLRWGEALNKYFYFIIGDLHAARGEWPEAVKSWHSAEGLIGGFSLKGLDVNTLKTALVKNEFQYLNMGMLLYFKNLHDNALSEFEKALSKNPDSVFSNYWIAQTYLKKRDRNSSKMYFERALSKAPRFFSALYATGELYFLTGKQETAIDYYKRALEVNKDVGILVKLGLIYESRKECAEAEKVYKEIINIMPDLFLGYNQLAWLYVKQGINLNKAMSLAEKADKLQPGNASIHDTLGWGYFLKKDYEKAQKYLETAHNINPQNPTILYHLGVLYSNIGKKQEAKDLLNKALQIAKNFEYADDARKLISEIQN